MSRATNTRVTPGYVEGTALAPYVEISIDFGAKMPGGGGLQNWVKNLPGRSWDPSTKTWRITGTGISKHPQDVFDKAGIELIWPEDGELADLDLEDLWDPVIVEDSFSSEAQVYPRFSGFEYVQQKIGPGAVWDKKNLCFNVRITDLIDGHGRYWQGLFGPKRLRTRAEDMFEPVKVPPRIADIAYQLAGDTGTDPDTKAGADGQKPMSPRVRKLIAEISDWTGKLPDWFGLNLYPFQEAGAYAAAAGHSMIVDPPGLGKTRAGLAVAAIHGAKRVLVICPPLVLSNWAHEASTALGPGFDPRKVPAPPKRGKATPYGTAVFYPGRKFPELPEEGVVIVAYSMLAARPELLQQVREWSAETLIVDESHLLRGWDSARGAVVRKLAGELEAGVRVPMTGTPILSTPEQLVNQLAISGHLDPVFGGASAFMEEYTSPDKFGGRRVLKKKLSQLHEILDEEVWVRRNKNEVLTQLPDKSRAVRYVDIDNRAFEKAHKELYAIIAEWVNDPATEYSIEAAEEWARENIGLISPLRVAAGMAKVPVAIEIIADWMEQTTTTVKGKKVYDRPLTVWAHHTVVLNALADSMDPKVAAFGVIDSSTSPQERARLVDEYQAGNIGVLFCKIIAAGFGITLTRGSDPLFVETEWSNSNVSQVEDRHHRIGQVHPVIATTLVAPDTLDPMIRAVQRRKTEILNEVLVGGDNDVANSDFIVNSDGVYEEIPDDERLLEKEYTSQYDVIIRIAEEIHAKGKGRKTKK